MDSRGKTHKRNPNRVTPTAADKPLSRDVHHVEEIKTSEAHTNRYSWRRRVFLCISSTYSRHRS